MAVSSQLDAELTTLAARRLCFAIAAGLSLVCFVVCLILADSWPPWDDGDPMTEPFRGFDSAPTLLHAALFGSAAVGIGSIAGFVHTSLLHVHLDLVVRRKAPPN